MSSNEETRSLLDNDISHPVYRSYGGSGAVSPGSDIETPHAQLLEDSQSSLHQEIEYTSLPSLPERADVMIGRWRSIRLMYLTMFLSSCSFSICMSSVWPYLKQLDDYADASFLGWVVAAFSLGQLVASPIFGWMANRLSKSLPPLLISICLNVAGNILYCYVADVPGNRVRGWCLLASRALIGFGAGNVAVTRSYVSGATSMEERTGAMAIMSAGQGLGFVLGPAFQAMFVPLGYPGPVELPMFRLDVYTAAGLFGGGLGVINIVLLWIWFEEHLIKEDAPLPPYKEDEAQVQGSVRASINSSLPSVDSSLNILNISLTSARPDYPMAWCMIGVFFVVLFVFALLETIMTPLVMDEYAWSRSQATLNVGIMLAVAGFCSIGVFLAVTVLAKRMKERNLLIIGFLFILSGYVILLPWGDQYLSVQMTDLSSQHQLSSPNSTEHLGCPSLSQPWCLTVPQIHLAQFLGGLAAIAVGYPACNVLTYAIFSKLLGPRPQGLWMGWLTASGSFARVLGPIYVSQIYQAYGPRITFSSVAGLILLCTLFICILYRRLVPWTERALRHLHHMTS